MSADWRSVTAATLEREGILLVQDGNHGEYRPRPSELDQGDVAFIRAADMENGRVLFESASRISDTAVQRIRKGIGASYDSLLSHKGTVGKVAYAGSDARPFVCSPQTTFWRSLDHDTLDHRYLYYYLHSPAFQRQLNARKGETDMADYVSLTAQRQLYVVLPPIDQQHAIGSILGAVDDKLELNRRMNRTLEAIAAATFRSWFVDFEPVVAKADGRNPFGMDAETAALFPDRFEESGVGYVPSGWDVASVPEIANINPRRTLKKGELAPYLEMAAMPEHGHAPSAWSERAPGSGARFQNGDTLLARITPCLENGKTALVDFLEDSQVGWGSTEYIVLHPRGTRHPAFVYCLARSPEFRAYAIQSMSGSSGRQRVAKDALDHYVLADPPETLHRIFGAFVTPLFQRARISLEESRTLAALRDTLLPRLLSGEIRLAEAEDLVEAHA
jgi:type I restriction enzyme, S subunit